MHRRIPDLDRPVGIPSFPRLSGRSACPLPLFLSPRAAVPRCFFPSVSHVLAFSLSLARSSAFPSVMLTRSWVGLVPPHRIGQQPYRRQYGELSRRSGFTRGGIGITSSKHSPCCVPAIGEYAFNGSAYHRLPLLSARCRFCTSPGTRLASFVFSIRSAIFFSANRRKPCQSTSLLHSVDARAHCQHALPSVGNRQFFRRSVLLGFDLRCLSDPSSLCPRDTFCQEAAFLCLSFRLLSPLILYVRHRDIGH